MDIKETVFPSQTYLVWRKEMPISEITNREMWQEAFGKVHSYIQEQNLEYAGPGTALYFSWDEKAGKTDVGIGNPINEAGDASGSELSLVPVAKSKAFHLLVKGDYGKLREAHAEITKYVVDEQGLTPTLTIEEYTVTGMDKPDSKDWETNIYYLYEEAE